MSLKRVGRLVFVVGMALALLAMGSWAQGQPPCTVTVSPGEAIQKAIDQAAEGAVICLTAGTWQENIEIIKSLTLRGAGKEPKEVRIVGVRGGHPVIRIESEREIEVVIENLTAAEAKGDRCAVYAQRICPYGLQALGKAKVLIKDVQVSGNEWYGLSMWDSATVSLTNSSVSDNWDDGLDVRGSAKATVRESEISGNKGNGVFLAEKAVAEIQGNRISNNAGYGVALYWMGCVVDYYYSWKKFAGQVTGGGNTIPGKDAADGNKKGDLCPPDYPWPPGFRK